MLCNVLFDLYVHLFVNLCIFVFNCLIQVRLRRWCCVVQFWGSEPKTMMGRVIFLWYLLFAKDGMCLFKEEQLPQQLLALRRRWVRWRHTLCSIFAQAVAVVGCRQVDVVVRRRLSVVGWPISYKWTDARVLWVVEGSVLIVFRFKVILRVNN